VSWHLQPPVIRSTASGSRAPCKQIDRLDPQALERGLRDRLDVLGAAVQPASALRRLRVEVEAELGGNRHLAFEGRKRLADELLVDERAIDSAVWKKLTPRSTAARISSIISCLSAGGP
jgi:hypothetical protein